MKINWWRVYDVVMCGLAIVGYVALAILLNGCASAKQDTQTHVGGCLQEHSVCHCFRPSETAQVCASKGYWSEHQ
jgi:hypothetical protein